MEGTQVAVEGIQWTVVGTLVVEGTLPEDTAASGWGRASSAAVWVWHRLGAAH